MLVSYIICFFQIHIYEVKVLIIDCSMLDNQHIYYSQSFLILNQNENNMFVDLQRKSGIRGCSVWVQALQKPVEEEEANSKAREGRRSASVPEALMVAEWLPWGPRKRTRSGLHEPWAESEPSPEASLRVPISFHLCVLRGEPSPSLELI